MVLEPEHIKTQHHWQGNRNGWMSSVAQHSPDDFLHKHTIMKDLTLSSQECCSTYSLIIWLDLHQAHLQSPAGAHLRIRFSIAASKLCLFSAGCSLYIGHHPPVTVWVCNFSKPAAGVLECVGNDDVVATDKTMGHVRQPRVALKEYLHTHFQWSQSLPLPYYHRVSSLKRSHSPLCLLNICQGSASHITCAACYNNYNSIITLQGGGGLLANISSVYVRACRNHSSLYCCSSLFWIQSLNSSVCRNAAGKQVSAEKAAASSHRNLHLLKKPDHWIKLFLISRTERKWFFTGWYSFIKMLHSAGSVQAAVQPKCKHGPLISYSSHSRCLKAALVGKQCFVSQQKRTAKNQCIMKLLLEHTYSSYAFDTH